MRTARFAMLSLVLLTAICIHGSVGAQHPAWTLVRIPEGFGVVIGERFTPASFPVGEGGVDGTWTPTADDIRKTEVALLGVRDASPPDVAPGRDVDIEALVSRQYFGLINDQTQLVYVNGFCSGGMPSDPTRLMIISDGGSCFWTATVNAETWEVLSYTENGHA